MGEQPLGVSIVCALTLFGLFTYGLASLVWPVAVWDLTEGWKVRDGVPSDEGIAVVRLRGVFTMIAALLCSAVLTGYLSV